MPLTRSDAEAMLVSRVGTRLFSLALFSVPGGSPPYYPDLNGPLADALDWFGHPPTSRSAVVDADLAWIPPSLQGRYLDRLEIATLKSIRTRVLGRPKKEMWDTYTTEREDVSKSLEMMIKEKETGYQSSIPTGSTVSVGHQPSQAVNQLDSRPFFPPYPAARPYPGTIPPDC